MKHWLMFVGGLLVGGAGGMFLGVFKGGGDGEDHLEGGRPGPNGSMIASGSPRAGSHLKGSRPGRPMRGADRGSGSTRTPAQVEDLLDYLQSLAEVDDLEEVNFLQLLRHGSLVTRMTEEEVKGAVEALRKREEESQGDDSELTQIFSALLFARYTELNGPAAMEAALGGGFGKQWEEDKDDLMAIGISSWVDADPKGAAAWFRGEGMSNPQFLELMEDSSVRGAFFAAMARHDTKVAMALAQGVGGKVEKDSMEVIARYEKTTEGLENILGQTAGQAQREVFSVMSERDPDAAAQWLARQNEIEERDSYVQTLAGEMLERDLEKGVKWYMDQEVSEGGRAMRYDRIVGHLSENDPKAASDWLGEQEDTPSRDRAEANLAQHLARAGQWTASFAWVAQVGHESQRKESLNGVFRRGWDRQEQTMKEQTAAAAREAGFGAHLDAYIDSASKERSTRNRR